MKKSIRKLTLSRETLRTLDDSSLSELKAVGGVSQKRCPTVDTRQISICGSCTGPFDSCPTDTGTLA